METIKDTMSKNMLRKISFISLIAGSLMATSASAASFSLFGTYWDTDRLGEAFGGGLAVGIPLGEVVELDLRASYLEELNDDPFDAIFDDDDVFQEFTVEMVPLDVGLRFNLQRRGSVNPYLGAGGTYYLLDTNTGNDIDDEVGYYGMIGARFGDAQGAGFFTEILYRKVEATVVNNDLDDFDVDESVSLDLDGFSAIAGFRWSW